jgi:hypothetical protein
MVKNESLKYKQYRSMIKKQQIRLSTSGSTNSKNIIAKLADTNILREIVFDYGQRSLRAFTADNSTTVSTVVFSLKQYI